MARKGITFDQVANAATAIRARGIEPTISAVRQELNGSGSYTTISNFLSRWRDEQADQPEPRALPPEVENSLLAALTTTWNVAVKLADREVAAVRLEASKEKEEADEKLAEAAAEIQTLEAALSSSEATKDTALEECKAMERKWHQAQAELDATKKLYAELLEKVSLKQPAETRKTSERPKSEQAEPGKKQA